MRPKRGERPVAADASLRLMIDGIHEGIIALDSQWRVLYANRAAQKMLAFRPAGLTGKNIWQEFPQSVGNPFYRVYHRVVETQRSDYVEGYSEQLGAWVGAAVYPSPAGLLIYFHDVTEKKKAEAEAQESNHRYRLLLDRITDGFIALDSGFCYLYANQKIGEMLRRDPESLIGKNVWQEFPEAVNSFTYRAFRTAMKEQRFISNVDYYAPLDLWQENYIYPSPEGLSVFIKDITERKKIELALQDEQRKLQRQTLAAALEAQEKERTHIGRELHDNMNQVLTATRLLLSLAREQPAGSDPLLGQCMANLDKVINENRALAHELVAPPFTEQSLVDEISALLQGMMAARGVEAKMDADGFEEDALTERQKLALYRIVQEQCTNVAKHAGATAVGIRLHTTATDCTLVIADNGGGSHNPQPAKGIGLRNIESRVQLFGGTLEVVNNPGKGFALHIGFPLV